ncbi:MAG TPA: beta-N-acetylhexosaminidase [Terriglobales bacterium]|nr:beta-N-acetylhexosaminidase [Terriglobales bacterium]
MTHLKSLRTSLLCAFVLLGTFAVAQDELKLIPYPRQVDKAKGQFVVSGTTSIILSPKHAKSDKIAAEMLAEEIESVTGKKPRVVTAAVAPANSIRLTRLSDPKLGDKEFHADTDEAYLITVTSGRITVAGKGDSGTFYGVQTLRQLLMPEGKKLAVPAVTVKDWPTMQWRGVHYDISRGPIPTMAYMKKVIRTLSEYKINLFSLYMEHVFDFPEQPIIAPKGAGITPAMVKELVEYAGQYHVTILPEQQAFGHLHHALKWELYTDMAERPHGHVLTPTNPKSYDFIKSMYAQLVPLFPGPLFHIGADETFELGLGQTKARTEEVGLGRVYLEHLQKVAEMMKPYNKRLMFWGDIAMHYPELLKILPKDVIAVAWKYDARPNFDEELKPYKDAGLDLFVAPGANNWNLIFPDLDEAYVNIRNFVRDGQKYGAMGMLNTTWMDDGEALFGMTWSPLVLGAACSWQQGECSLDQFANSYDWAFYRNAQDHSFHNALKKLTETHNLLKKAGIRNAHDTAYWMDPFGQAWADYSSKALPVVRDVRLSAEEALDLLYKNRDKARIHNDTIDPLLLGGYRLDALGLKVQMMQEIGDYYATAYANSTAGKRVGRELNEINGMNARLQSLRDSVTYVKDMYSAQWLRENHPYWLGNVTVRYDVLTQSIQKKINELNERGRANLPAPEEIGFRQIKPAAPPQASQPK